MYPLLQGLPPLDNDAHQLPTQLSTLSRSGQPVSLCINRIAAPVFRYLPLHLASELTDRVTLTLGVMGDLDRALTERATEFSSESLLEAAEGLRSQVGLICIKGFDYREDLKGFRRLPGLPRAVLKLRPTYWQDIGSKKRADLLRQRKLGQAIRKELRDGFPLEHADRILELYRQTRDKASLKLLDHDLGYFKSTAPVSAYLLYFFQGELIAFHQLISDGPTMYSQYVGMDYAAPQSLRVYFNLLIDSIDIGIERSKREIDFGITSYRYKKHIGCEIQPTWNYFQPSYRWLNWAMPVLDPILSPNQAMLA